MNDTECKYKNQERLKCEWELETIETKHKNKQTKKLTPSGFVAYTVYVRIWGERADELRWPL